MDNISGVINKSFRIYREKWKDLVFGSFVYLALSMLTFSVLVGLPALVLVVLGIVGGISYSHLVLPTVIGSFVMLLVLMALAVAVVGIFMGGFLIFCNDIIDGKKPKWSEMLSPPRRASFAAAPFVQIIPMATLFLLFIGAVVAFLFLSGFSMDALVSNPMQALSITMILIIGFVVCVILSLVISFFLILTTYAIALEGTGAIDGAKRSIYLVRNNIVDFFVFMLLIAAIMFGLSLAFSIVTMPISLVASFVPGLSLVSNLLGFIFNVFVMPIPVVAWILFYKRLIGKENARAEPIHLQQPSAPV